MKDKDILRIKQLEDTVSPFRPLLDARPPHGGWVRATREALGMTGAQLARRRGKTASQSIEDMQRSEVDKTIKLTTLEQLGQALGCRLVYALVPEKPLEELLRDRARTKAQRKVGRVSHSMKLEEQGIGPMEESRALEMLTERFLRGDPKKLWD